MLPLSNSLTNEDPLSKIEEILALRSCWYCQVFLILSNVPGILAVYTLIRLGFSMFGISVAVAVIYSIGYHLCQSVGYCFLSNLVIWTMLDHISAPAMMAMVIIFVVNTRSMDMIRATHRMVLSKMKKQTNGGRNLTLGSYGNHGGQDVTLDVSIENDNYNYYYSRLYIEENSTYDAWSATIVYCYIFIAIHATLTHPFSMQSFIIVISFGLGVIFLKIIVIDGGDITDTEKRVSVPELVVGVVLIAVSLVFFVLDGVFPPQYWILHTLWHVFSFIGVYFYALGLTKNTPYWYSPYSLVKEKTRRLFRAHARGRSLKN